MGFFLVNAGQLAVEWQVVGLAAHPDHHCEKLYQQSLNLDKWCFELAKVRIVIARNCCIHKFIHFTKHLFIPGSCQTSFAVDAL